MTADPMTDESVRELRSELRRGKIVARVAEFTEVCDEVLRLRSAVREVNAKAELWDALMHCRMRTSVGAKVNDASTPYAYLTIELWELFDAFMVKARAQWLASREGKS